MPDAMAAVDHRRISKLHICICISRTNARTNERTKRDVDGVTKSMYGEGREVGRGGGGGVDCHCA